MSQRKLIDTAKFAAQVATKAGAKEARSIVSRTREVKVEWRDGKLDRISESTKLSLLIDLYVDGRYSSNTTSDIRDEAVTDYVKGAVATTKYLAIDNHRHLPDPSMYKDLNRTDLQRQDPSQGGITPESRLSLAKEIESATRAGDRQNKIISVTATVGDVETQSAIFNTNGFEAEAGESNFWQIADVSVRDTGDRKPSGYSYGVKRFHGDLPNSEKIGSEALKRAMDQIGSQQVETGIYDAVIESQTADTLAYYLFSPLSGGAIQQKQSFLEDKLEKAVASKILTITDDPHLPRGLASSAWDNEGMATKKRAVIEKGVLKTFFLDTYYASKLGRAPTSGGPSNLVWSTGKRDSAAMIKDIKKGILVTSFLGGNSNSTTGDFSLGVKGFLIKNGKLDQPVSEMNIAGNHLQLWMNLVELGNDPWAYGSNLVPSLHFKKVQFSGSKDSAS